MGSQPRGISASRGAAILGVSPYMTQTEVWQVILEERTPGWNAAHGYTLPEGVADKPSVRWGTAFEDAVCELAQKAGPAHTIDGRELFFAIGLDNLPRFDGEITCHIDGFYAGTNEPNHFHTLHEGKTTTDWNLRENWGEPGSDKVPIQIQVQAQHQMLCTGASKNIVSVLAFPKSPEQWEEMGWRVGRFNGFAPEPNPTWLIYKESDGSQLIPPSMPISEWANNLALMGYFHQYPVAANPVAQAEMLKRYRRFWERNILGEHPPKPESTDDLRRLFPSPSGTLIVTPAMEKKINQIGHITEEIGTAGPLAKRKEALKVQVIESARKMDRTIDDESRDKTLFMTTEGKKIATWNGKTLSLSRK